MGDARSAVLFQLFRSEKKHGMLHRSFGFRVNPLDQATRCDFNLLTRYARFRADLLDRLDDVHAVCDRAEDDVLAVEMLGRGGGDEELASVCVFAGVGH